MYVAKNCFNHIKQCEETKNCALTIDFNSLKKDEKCNEIQVYPSELAVKLTGYYDLPYDLKNELKLLGFKESKSHYRYIAWRVEPFSEEFKEKVRAIVKVYNINA